MQAREAKFLEVIKKSPQFQIPLYQRTYSWTERECKQLWEDILRAGSNDAIKVHFIGSIVYVESGVGGITHQAPVLVIDGQQRLTTVTLLLAALAQTLGEEEPLDGFSTRKIKNYYLVNPEESGERFYKLVLSQTDKDTLTSIVDEREMPDEHSIRIKENFEFFKKLLDSKADLLTVCKGIAKLVIVDIALTRDQDNPQLIFESMNSTGKELSQADLIRNFILMGLEHELQSRLYNNFWRRMELDFGQEAYSTDFDAFMRHYLTVRTGSIPNINEVYDAFKLYSRNIRGDRSEAEHIEALVKDIRDFASYYCHIALEKETDSELKKAFHDIRELKVDVAYPFLIELYSDYAAGTLSRDDFVAIVRLTESYVFRRAICNIPTNSMNKTFANFTKAIDKTNYLESVKAHYLLLPSYRRFPEDEEFFRNIQVRDLYNFRTRSYWLRRFENYGKKEYVQVNEYTIEHIMPQNENLSAEWREALGPEWERIQKTWLHTLGNLTLTAYNSEYSDRPFAYKRDMPDNPIKGLKQSPLKVNQGLGQIENWNENEIVTRAERLAKEAVEVWGSPVLSKDILEAYRAKTAKAETVHSTYTIDDHPYLTEGSSMYGNVTPPLYQAIRKEIMALDPSVTEEFTKHYVAYKAETNFVDIVPQAQGLLLILNMRFSELNDPRGIARDLSNQGRWGNGEVDVKLSSLEELPYVLGLIRQSLELQLGTDTD